jgi:heterotetrameric sarcosine oxidase gamma subunit
MESACVPDLRLSATKAIDAAASERNGTRLWAPDEGSVLTLVLRTEDPTELDREISAGFGVPLPEIGRLHLLPDKSMLLRPSMERAYVLGETAMTFGGSEFATILLLDQSDFWVEIRLAGAAACSVLERGWKLRLDDGHFPPGSVARSRLWSVACILIRRAECDFSALVPRSYALAAYEELETSLRWVS